MELDLETILGMVARKAAELTTCPVAELRHQHPDAFQGPVRDSKADCIEAILFEYASELAEPIINKLKEDIYRCG